VETQSNAPSVVTQLKTVWTDERAQTVEDYALGMGYFLITIMFVFAFLTGVTLPYESASGNGQDIRADRVANTLVQDTLSGGAEGATETTLSPSCTEAFFANESSDCGYEPGSLDAEFATSSGDTLYIEIAEPDSEIAQRSGSAITQNGVTMFRGDAPPAQMRSSTTERLVSLNGDAYMLRVVVQ
jgi:hypothetical protein